MKKPQTQSPAKKDQGIKKENKRVDSSEDDDSDGDFGPLWDDDDDDDVSIEGLTLCVCFMHEVLEVTFSFTASWHSNLYCTICKGVDISIGPLLNRKMPAKKTKPL